MDPHAGQVSALCVGVAYYPIAGTQPQAPKWMQEAGLEWLFRLASEPRRPFKRYLVSNTAFIYYFLTGRF